jgi:hypothetical protein
MASTSSSPTRLNIDFIFKPLKHMAAACTMGAQARVA